MIRLEYKFTMYNVCCILWRPVAIATRCAATMSANAAINRDEEGAPTHQFAFTYDPNASPMMMIRLSQWIGRH